MKKLISILMTITVLAVMIVIGAGCDSTKSTEESAVEETEESAVEETEEEEESTAGVAESTSVEDITVAICGHGLEAESCQRDFQQVKIECAHRNWEFIDCMTVRDSTQQRETMETLIEKKVDAIVIIYWDVEAIADLILKAQDAGIGVYCVDTELRPGVIASSTQDNAIAGAIMANWGITRLNEAGKVAIYSGKWHIMRRRGYVAATLFERDFPALELVAEEFLPMETYEQDAMDATENLITKYGNDLDWIFSGWDTPGQIAAQMVEQAGFTRDDIFITGIDGGSAVYSMIREGSPFAATVSQPFELYVHNIFEVINQVESGIMPGDPGSIVPESRIIYETPVTTDETNVPDPGTSIHAVFNYYDGDPDDPNAWYNWQEEGGPYQIQ